MALSAKFDLTRFYSLDVAQITLNTARKPKAGRSARKSQEKGSPEKSMTFDEVMENNDKESSELITPKVEAEAAKGPTVFHYFPNLVRSLYILSGQEVPTLE